MKRRFEVGIFFLLFLIQTLFAQPVEILNPQDSPDPFSPNDDTIKDECVISFTSSKHYAKWNVTIRNSLDNPVREYNGMLTGGSPDVTIAWDGKDFSGNILPDDVYKFKIVLEGDITPPETTVAIGDPKYLPAPDEPPVISGITPIIFTSTDPVVNDLSSGVEKIEYKIGLEGSWQEYSGSIDFSSIIDGEYTIYYRATDYSGNIEEDKSFRIRLDKTPPVFEVLSPPNGALVNGNITIFGSVTDPYFDLYKIEYIGEISGIIKPDTTTPVTKDTLGIWSTIGLPAGNYTIILYAQDKLRNSITLNLNLIIGEMHQVISFGSLGEMNKPMYIAADTAGNLYVTDENNNRVKKYTKDGQFICNIIEGFDQPQGIALDTADNIYVSGHQSLVKYNSVGEKIWERTGFNQPAGIKISQNGKLYIADRNNNRIVIYTKEGEFAGEIKGYFNKPMDLAFDNTGNIYVADSENNRIVLLDKNNNYIGKFGECCVGAGYFNRPEGIAIAQLPTSDVQLVYVTDGNNDLVKVFDKNGYQLYQFGGNGNSDGRFNKPEGILADSDGNIYVVDRNNNRVQKFGLPKYEVNKTDLLSSGIGSKIEIKNHISYPSPFSPNGDGVNDEAKIRFELSEPAEVQVKIYNMIGKLVFVYDKMDCSAGANEVLWEGVNNAGKRINNGVYIYHIRAKGISGKATTVTGSVVIVK